MFRADCHIHTRNSDGYNTIDEIIEMAVKSKLTHIAITNHDTLKGYEETKIKTEENGIKTVKSLEISAIDKDTGIKVHLLGYNIKKDYIIEELCSDIVSQRNDKAKQQIEILNKKGYKIDYDELYEFSKGYIFKQHIFDMLLRTNQTESMFPSINETLFKNKAECDLEIDYIDVREAVKAVKASGGYAVIAHPGQQKNIYLVEKLVKLGLDGLELNHEANNNDYRKIIIDEAKKYNLILTGGSDYHGIYARRDTQVGSYLCENNAEKIFQ